MKKHLHYILLPAVIFIISCNNNEQKQQFKTGSIKAGNLQVYYERTGKGDAILFLHAGLQDHTMWAEQVKALSAQYEVITIDLPYHGKTMGTDTTLLVADMIKILLDSLQLQKVSVAGLSMGGSVAQDFIIAYPERVNKAILISAGINGYEKTHAMDSISTNWWQAFRQALNDKDTIQAAIEFTKAWAEGPYRNDKLQAPVSKNIYSKTLENLTLHKMEGWPLLQDHPPAIEKISSIKVPVLIIDGDKDMPYITANAVFMEKNIPGAKRVLMKDVAHMLNIERPDELNKLIMDFLKQ